MVCKKLDQGKTLKQIKELEAKGVDLAKKIRKIDPSMGLVPYEAYHILLELLPEEENDSDNEAL